MILKLLNYDLNVIYKPGKYLFIADTLSRAFLTKSEDSTQLNLEYNVHALSNYLPISNEKKDLLRNSTKKDPQLQCVINFVKTQWPSNKRLVPILARHFYKLKYALSISDELLFFNTKLIVPKDLREEMLTKLHEGHLGIEKVKARARQIFYWPLMSQDIENYIKKCRVCERFAMKNSKQELLSYPIPERPWERVGADIFSYGDRSYLVVMDAYSNWLELVPLKNKSANEVITKLKSIFSIFGCPDKLVCDNVPFGSFSFKGFSKEWNFDMVLRSPNYPRSNGLAEKAVGIAKKLLKKSLEEGKEIFEALIQYRNSPLKFLNYSPSQLLMSRICKTKLPVSADLLKPSLCENVKERLELRQGRNKNYFNKNATDLKPLDPDQNVSIFNHVNNHWEPGKILDFAEGPRSYRVLDSHGNVIKRNRFDLRESQINHRLDLDTDINDFKFDCENGNTVRHSPAKFDSHYSERTQLPTEIQPDSDDAFVRPSSHSLDLHQKSKSGRTIKRPDRLNL